MGVVSASSELHKVLNKFTDDLLGNLSEVVSAYKALSTKPWNNEQKEYGIELSLLAEKLLSRLGKEIKGRPASYTDDSILAMFENYFGQVDGFLKDALVTRALGKLESSSRIDSEFGMVLPDADKKEIQSKIDDLRRMVTDAAFLSDRHRSRLLARLEAMQAELHKVVGDYEKFLGGVADAGKTMGQFGEDARPILNLFREITEAVWKRSTPELSDESSNVLLTAPTGEDR